MEVKINVVGMEEFRSKLERLETAAAKKARVAALTAGAKIVQADAARRAARSARPRKIGHLADRIIIKTTINKKNETEVAVGPDAKHWYGVFVERGVKSRGIGERPFLRPALEDNLDAVKSEIRRVLHAEIMAAIGR